MKEALIILALAPLLIAATIILQRHTPQWNDNACEGIGWAVREC